MTSILRYGVSTLPAKKITADDTDRILLCIRVLVEDNERLNKAFVEDCGKALAYMLHEQAEFEAIHKKKKKDVIVQPDEPILFNQLVSKNDIVNGEDVFETSLSQAVGFNPKKSDGGDVSCFAYITCALIYVLIQEISYSCLLQFSSSKLSKVTQLTGFSDPVYAEAYINVNQFDIVLDVLLVNQTGI